MVSALRLEEPPFVVPAATLGEVSYFLETRDPYVGTPPLINDLRHDRFRLDCGEGDLGRIDHLVRRYADLPLGFVDAAVIACAERRGGRVLTLDRRHFGVVGREGTLTLLP